MDRTLMQKINAEDVARFSVAVRHIRAMSDKEMSDKEERIETFTPNIRKANQLRTQNFW